MLNSSPFIKYSFTLCVKYVLLDRAGNIGVGPAHFTIRENDKRTGNGPYTDLTTQPKSGVQPNGSRTWIGLAISSPIRWTSPIISRNLLFIRFSNEFRSIFTFKTQNHLTFGSLPQNLIWLWQWHRGICIWFRSRTSMDSINLNPTHFHLYVGM